MPENDARGFGEGAGKRYSRFWRKVPESDARSLEEGAEKRCSECGHAEVCERVSEQ